MTIKSVAARAGVSPGTVSHVLNHPDRVRPQTRARVEAAIAELGFVPNATARQLRAGRSDTVAFLIPDAANPFFTDLAKAFRDAANRVGLSVFLCDAGYDARLEDLYLDRIEHLRARGVFLASPRQGNPRLQRLRDHGVQVVLIDQVRSGSTDWCAVTVDDVCGGQLATEHLLSRSRVRLAYAGGSLDIPQVADRIAGARLSMTASGRSPGELDVITTVGMTMDDGRAAAESLLERPPDRRATGVFCGNDLVALGMLHELLRRGVRVPEDVAIVGYDGIDFARTSVVPLTSVVAPLDRLAASAMRLLMDECQGGVEHDHRQLLHPPQLVIRESSMGSRSSDRRVMA
jgi:LacI family transcriptional regulator